MKKGINWDKRENDYYLHKFGQKMQGSPFSTAKEWVEGTGIMDDKSKIRLLGAIKKKYY